ncbi:hypothetical protein IP87_03155 [beta proteobacterium AAP121]|nr:hypothetical protein IP80_11595 [beta proteobacterium AAP65]KPG00349.1 hypothetical protein IP87_03155 [beta proteobacterium AAP121]
MRPPVTPRSRRLLGTSPAFALLLALAGGPAAAQPAAPGPAPAASTAASAAATGTALDGQAFKLPVGDGRVRVLMFWRTDCAVCLNKMPELRANAQGWRERPFDLVLINTDARRGDAVAYDRLRRDLNGRQGPLISTWTGDVQLPRAWQAGAGAPRLPLMLVIDGQGRVTARHEGRVPPELWDEVAELLP